MKNKYYGYLIHTFHCTKSAKLKQITKDSKSLTHWRMTIIEQTYPHGKTWHKFKILTNILFKPYTKKKYVGREIAREIIIYIQDNCKVLQICITTHWEKNSSHYQLFLIQWLFQWLRFNIIY